MRKQTLQDKIGRTVMEKPGWNRRMLHIKKSLDQVKDLLDKGKKKT